jgi:hypothetical protein
MTNTLSKEVAVRLALAQLGDVSAADLASFMEQQYGVKIDPKFVPVFKASIRDKEQMERARQARSTAAEQQIAVGSAQTP